MLSTSVVLPPARRRDEGEAAIVAWLTDAQPPWFGAAIWRLYLDREHARALLTELDSHAIPVRVSGVTDASGAWRLYLWPAMPVPGLMWLLLSHDASATLIHTDHVRGGPVWACGTALRRLLGFNSR